MSICLSQLTPPPPPILTSPLFQQPPHSPLPLPPPHPLHLPPQPLPHPPHQHHRVLLVQLLPLALAEHGPAPRLHLGHVVADARYDVEMHVRDDLRGARSYKVEQEISYGEKDVWGAVMLAGFFVYKVDR